MPPRKSDTLKLIAGTGRRDRQPRMDPTTRLAKAPRPPASLSPRAAAEWREMAPVLVAAGLLTSADLRLLAMLSETLAMEAELRDLVRTEGVTIPAAEGAGRKGHPALKAILETRAQGLRMLEAFGMSPASRQRVDPAPAGRDDNSPFARLKALQRG